jgi:hypothetical protein
MAVTLDSLQFRTMMSSVCVADMDIEVLSNEYLNVRHSSITYPNKEYLNLRYRIEVGKLSLLNGYSRKPTLGITAGGHDWYGVLKNPTISYGQVPVQDAHIIFPDKTEGDVLQRPARIEFSLSGWNGQMCDGVTWAHKARTSPALIKALRDVGHSIPEYAL